MPIGTDIKRYRKAKGYTQQQLADLLGVSVMTIRRFETGARQPKSDMIEKIFEVLDVSAEQLLEETQSSIILATNKLHEMKKSLIVLSNMSDLEIAKVSEKLNSKGKGFLLEFAKFLTTLDEYTTPDE